MKSSTPCISETTLKHPHALPPVTTRRSLTKAVIVNVLGSILAWRPRLAMILARVVTWCWRTFPEA